MRNTKKAFTLVELIVVITILAILGTIAFISLQGYSADARNSKRTSDIGNIQSAITLKNVEGTPLLSFVTANVANELVPIALGWTAAASQTNYAAGTPTYSVLNIVEKDFLDPLTDKAYRVWVTEDRGWVFQVAATMEKDGTDTAQVNGTFVQRLSTTSATVSAIDENVVTVDDAYANFFKVGDYVESQTSTWYTVSKVSRDGVTVTLSANAGSDLTALNLVTDESAGLIMGTNDSNATWAVENLDTGTTGFLPY